MLKAWQLELTHLGLPPSATKESAEGGLECMQEKTDLGLGCRVLCQNMQRSWFWCATPSVYLCIMGRC